MSNSNQNNSSFLQGPGYRIYSKLFDPDHCEKVFYGASLELCYFVLGEDAGELIKKYGIAATRAITDVEFRRKIGVTDCSLRRNGNPRESKVLKKSGKTSLYTSLYIRDGIRRSQSLFSVLKEFYGTEKLSFTHGLDPLIYKTGGSEESIPTLDFNIFEPLISDIRDPRYQNNGFHYVCLVCVSTAAKSSSVAGMTEPMETESTDSELGSSVEDGSNNNFKTGYGLPQSGNNFERDESADGSISILQGFDLHFNDIVNIISRWGKYPILQKKKKGTSSTKTVLENFNLHGVNDELHKIYDSRSVNGEQAPFVPLRWVKISMKAGDTLVFDCRIPYKTARNKFDLPTLFVPVSIRPIYPGWYNSIQHKYLLAGVKEGKAGDWAKRKFKDCNLEEYTWRNSQKVLPYSTLKSCSDIQSFSDHDKLLFGVAQYII